MSQALISRNDELRRLRNEGYEIRIQDGLLLVAHVPYVNAQRSSPVRDPCSAVESGRQYDDPLQGPHCSFHRRSPV